MKRNFGGLTLADAMRLIPAERFTPWTPEAAPPAPTDRLLDRFRRFQSFDLKADGGKLLLIDSMFAEVVPKYPRLNVCKVIALDSEVLSGFAEYVITPDYAYLKTPLFCGEQAKGDNFVHATPQCIAELIACRALNAKPGLEIDIFGAVSNRNSWQFYSLSSGNTVYESADYAVNDLPKLLGMLDFVCAACAANVPPRAFLRTN